MVKVWKVFFDRASARFFLWSLFACFLAFLKANCYSKMPVMQPSSRALVQVGVGKKTEGVDVRLAQQVGAEERLSMVGGYGEEKVASGWSSGGCGSAVM